MEVKVFLKPNSKKGPIVEKCLDNKEIDLIIFLREPAIENKANNALITILSKHFNVAKSMISIKTGHKSKIKTIHINKYEI